MTNCLFYQKEILTPLGNMLAVANEQALYVLEFSDQKGLDKALAKLPTQRALVTGDNAILQALEQELTAYFAGQLTSFHTPIVALGTPFQQQVWQQLQQIPYGQTVSYQHIARAMQCPTAVRAVGNSNGKNPLAIIVPCHRVVQANGALGGYAGGLWRKEWLLQHEGATKPLI